MVIHHPSKFGGRWRCESRDSIILVVREVDFRYCHFNPPLLFSCKRHRLKAHGISYE